MVGRTFVITGTLRSPRAEVKRLIAAAGDHVAGSVSNNTDFVVAGPDVAGTNKLNRAHQLGIPIITEAQLWSKIGFTPAARPNVGKVVHMRTYGYTARAKPRLTRRTTTRAGNRVTYRSAFPPYKTRTATTKHRFLRLANSKNKTKKPAKFSTLVVL